MTYGILLAETGGSYMQFALLIGVIVVFYFFMIRPQQKKQKELKNFRDSLAKGSEVVTTGGIFGKVLSIEDTNITLEIDRGVKIKVLKNSISSVAQASQDTTK